MPEQNTNNPTETTELIKCYSCNSELHDNTARLHGGHLYCGTCWSEQFFDCYSCESTFDKNDSNCGSRFPYSERLYCSDCFNDRFSTCNNCEDYIISASLYDGQCVECRTERNTELDMKKYISKPRQLTFGIEIEARRSDSYDYHDINLPMCLIEEDGSINNGHGIEIITPPANGKNLESIVYKATDELKKMDFTVNTSCGLHVHAGVKKDALKLHKQLFLTWLATEAVFYSLVPASRKNNTYCRAFNSVHSGLNSEIFHEIHKTKPQDFDVQYYRTLIDKELSKRSIDGLKQDKYVQCRYFGVNFHSIYYRGTLEFRLHSGTLNPEKILHWVTLLDSFILYSKNRFKVKDIIYLNSLPNTYTKILKTFELFKVPKKTKDFYLKKFVQLKKKELSSLKIKRDKMYLNNTPLSSFENFHGHIDKLNRIRELQDRYVYTESRRTTVPLEIADNISRNIGNRTNPYYPTESGEYTVSDGEESTED